MVIYIMNHKRYTSIQSARKAAVALASRKMKANPWEYEGRKMMVAIRKENMEPYGAVVVRPENARNYRPPQWHLWDKDKHKTIGKSQSIDKNGRLTSR